MKERKLLKLKDLQEKYSYLFPLSTLRYWIYKRESNGANCWIRKIGGKIFVDVDEFFKWLEGRSKF